MWRYFDNLLAHILIKLILIYQRSLSLDHSWLRVFKPYGQCRFRPTCSEYAILALTKYGALRGSLRALWRLLRCNPFSSGGYDPLL